MGNIQSLCDDFALDVSTVYFDHGKLKKCGYINLTQERMYREYFQPIKACVEICRFLNLRMISFEHDFYSCIAHLDSTQEANSLENFNHYLKGVKVGFEKLKAQISAFCSAFDDEEKKRINEAIHDHLECCYYSSVAMSVSAIESRLLKLMCLAKPDSAKELEKKTLGQLVNEYVENKDKYKNIIPAKHEPLLSLCNIYRTFSVHPKKQKVTGTVADSILKLAVEFLTDPETNFEMVKAQLSAGA